MPNRRPSPLALALTLCGAIVALSFAAIFFRLAFPTHPLTAAGIRLLIAGTLFSPFVYRGIRRGTFTPTMYRAALLGGLLYGIHFGTWVTSLTLTSVAAAVTLVTTNPIFLGLLSLLTGRDRPGSRFWWGLGLAFIGLLILGGADFAARPEALWGNLLAILGAVAMSLYLFTARSQGERLDWVAFSGVTTASGGFALIVAAWIIGAPLTPSSTGALGFIVLAALIPQMIGHSLLVYAVRHLKPTTVAMAVIGEPVGSTLMAWLWLGEVLSAATTLGCAITLLAVLLVIGARSAPPLPDEPP